MEHSQNEPQHIVLIFAIKKGPTCQKLNENAANSPDIDPTPVRRMCDQQLRRPVPPRADVLSQRGRTCLIPSRAEVTNLQDTILGQKHVFWLDVPVNDPFLVHVSACLHHLVNDLFGF